MINGIWKFLQGYSYFVFKKKKIYNRDWSEKTIDNIRSKTIDSRNLIWSPENWEL